MTTASGCSRGCCPSPRHHWLSVSVSATATPSRTRASGVIAKQQDENAFAVDGPAYRRLRKDGLQPRSIDGCAELEARAATQIEVEMGNVMDPKLARMMHETLETAHNIVNLDGDD